MTPALARIEKPAETTMLEIREHCEQHGLVLITNGRDLAYTLPHHIPLGWRRFVLVDRSRPLDPTEPRG